MKTEIRLLPILSRKSGFTLIELIVVITVVAIMALLLVSGSRSIFDRKNNLECVSNIRQTGMAMQHYITDSNNMLYSFHGGADVTDMWVRRLFMGGYFMPNRTGASENEILTYQIGSIGHLLRCPTGNIGADFLDYKDHPRKWIWQTYGMAMYDQDYPIEFITVNGKNSNLYSANVNTISDPSNYILLADSGSTAPNYYQSFRISRYQGSGGIAMRHNKKANVFFLDGHVAAIDVRLAEDLGIPGFNIHEIE